MGVWWTVRGVLGGAAAGYALCLLSRADSALEVVSFVGGAAALGLLAGLGVSCLKQRRRDLCEPPASPRGEWWLLRGLLGGVFAGVAAAYYLAAPALPSRNVVSLSVLAFLFIGLFFGWSIDIGQALVRNRRLRRTHGGD
ncbi:MAG TPA: hypothetical protein VMV10_10625 [Pirellulales bacterium]|nr:hypothetical protein [Pirellulales bacterium]